MKRILVAGSLAALALVGSAGAATAAPSDAACFGQIHKAVNGGALAGIDNVGQLVQAVDGGPAKNAAATGLCG
jgi:hypothetical protein